MSKLNITHLKRGKTGLSIQIRYRHAHDQPKQRLCSAVSGQQSQHVIVSPGPQTESLNSEIFLGPPYPIDTGGQENQMGDANHQGLCATRRVCSKSILHHLRPDPVLHWPAVPDHRLETHSWRHQPPNYFTTNTSVRLCFAPSSPRSDSFLASNLSLQIQKLGKIETF